MLCAHIVQCCRVRVQYIVEPVITRYSVHVTMLDNYVDNIEKCERHNIFNSVFISPEQVVRSVHMQFSVV